MMKMRSLTYFLRSQKRSLFGIAALAIVICTIVVLAMTADQSVTLQDDNDGALPVTPTTTIVPVIPTPALPHQQRRLVREVERQDWHQLDGDQLIPAHGNDNPDVLEARRQHSDNNKNMKRSILAQPTVPALPHHLPDKDHVEAGWRAPVTKEAQPILAQPRVPAPRHQIRRAYTIDASSSAAQQQQLQELRRQEQQELEQRSASAVPAGRRFKPRLIHRTPEGRAGAVPLSEAAGQHSLARVTEDNGANAQDTEKIALQSLRLVVHLAEDEDDPQPQQQEQETSLSIQVAPHVQKLTQRLRNGGRPILLAHPAGRMPAHAPLQSRRLSGDHPAQDATLAQQQEVLSVKEKSLASATSPATSLGVIPAATCVGRSRRIRTDEAELYHRCAVANGRSTQAAVLRAMLEGRLRNDCIIVAADVGNDIPTNENNAKGAVTIVSLFVSTLFLVFVFIF